jgi:Zinc finger C-x8-C-x5-C-x3-H type (and similar)
MSQLVARRGADHYTQLCPNFMRGWCPFGLCCTFLHGNDDSSRTCVLRARGVPLQEQVSVPVDAMHRAHGQNGSDHYTAPCWYWPGNCKHGERCFFRHGDDDPRALARQRAVLDRQPEGAQQIGTHASIALLQWLKGRLHAAKVSILMRTLR